RNHGVTTHTHPRHFSKVAKIWPSWRDDSAKNAGGSPRLFSGQETAYFPGKTAYWRRESAKNRANYGGIVAEGGQLWPVGLQPLDSYSRKMRFLFALCISTCRI